MTLPRHSSWKAIAQCTSRWAMARGHRLNTSIVLAEVHGLSGLFRAVSAVEPSLFRPLPPLSPSLVSHLASVDVKQNGPGPTVMAVSHRHCPVASALRNCCFNCRAWAESQRQCPLHCCWAITPIERSPTFAAQLRLPTHDLFWANLKVQLHLPPLDLSIFWSRLEPCSNSDDDDDDDDELMLNVLRCQLTY